MTPVLFFMSLHMGIGGPSVRDKNKRDLASNSSTVWVDSGFGTIFALRILKKIFIFTFFFSKTGVQWYIDKKRTLWRKIQGGKKGSEMKPCFIRTCRFVGMFSAAIDWRKKVRDIKEGLCFSIAEDLSVFENIFCYHWLEKKPRKITRVWLENVEQDNLLCPSVVCEYGYLNERDGKGLFSVMERWVGHLVLYTLVRTLLGYFLNVSLPTFS